MKRLLRVEFVLFFLFTSFTQFTASGGTKIGIGVVIDSATNLSRSFALFEMLNDNPLVGPSDTLKATLTEYYPYSYDFGITGIFNSKNCAFKIYQRGKKYKEITTKNDWLDIYQQIASVMKEFGYVPRAKFKTVSEGSIETLGSKGIKEYLPGTIVYETPLANLLDSVKKQINIKFIYKTDPYKTTKEVYGNFSSYKNNDIFFFRNGNVPEDIKDGVRPLIYPRYNSLHPTLIYLANGYNLKPINIEAALNCYYSAIASSNRLISSRFEKALLRDLAFNELAAIYSSVQIKRKRISELLSLAGSLNKVYAESSEGYDEKLNYLKEVRRVGTLAVDAEEAAKKIRAANWNAAANVVGSTANAFQSASQGDQAGVKANNAQAELAQKEYSKQISQSRALLDAKFKDIDEKIYRDMFLVGEDAEAAYMKLMITPEVEYFMKLSPNLCKQTIETFSKDKPKLGTMVADFYSASEELREIKLMKIILYFKEYEKKLYNTEFRGEGITINAIETQFAKIEPQLDAQLAERQRKMIEAKAAQIQASQELVIDDDSSPKMLFIVNLKSKLMIDGKLKAILEPNKPNKILVSPGEFYMEIIPPFDESKKIFEVIKSPGKGEQAVKKVDFATDFVAETNIKLNSNPSVFDTELSQLSNIVRTTKPEGQATTEVNPELNKRRLEMESVIVAKWKADEVGVQGYKLLDFNPNYTVVAGSGITKGTYKWQIVESKKGDLVAKIIEFGNNEIRIVSSTEIDITFQNRESKPIQTTRYRKISD